MRDDVNNSCRMKKIQFLVSEQGSWLITEVRRNIPDPVRHPAAEVHRCLAVAWVSCHLYAHLIHSPHTYNHSLISVIPMTHAPRTDGINQLAIQIVFGYWVSGNIHRYWIVLSSSRLTVSKSRWSHTSSPLTTHNWFLALWHVINRGVDARPCNDFGCVMAR